MQIWVKNRTKLSQFFPSYPPDSQSNYFHFGNNHFLKQKKSGAAKPRPLFKLSTLCVCLEYLYIIPPQAHCQALNDLPLFLL